MMSRFWALGALLCICISAVDLCERPNRCIPKGSCVNILKDRSGDACWYSEDCCADGVWDRPQQAPNNQQPNQEDQQPAPQAVQIFPANSDPLPDRPELVLIPSGPQPNVRNPIQVPPNNQPNVRNPIQVPPNNQPNVRNPIQVPPNNQPNVRNPIQVPPNNQPNQPDATYPIPVQQIYPLPAPSKNQPHANHPIPVQANYPIPVQQIYPIPVPPKNQPNANYPIPVPPKNQPVPEPPNYQPAPQDKNCGLSNRNPLIVSSPVPGSHPFAGQYPWTVALFQNGEYFGGGSLVAPAVVLTVAHLVVNMNQTDIVARAGDFDFLLRSNQLPPDERHVVRIQVHNNFRAQSGANDLALLYLKTPFTLRSHIRPICLPQQNETFDQKRCVVAGWGKRSVGDLPFADVQNKMDLPVLAKLDCQDLLKQGMGPDFQLHESIICAGGDMNQDGTFVNAGSPLFCPLVDQPDRYVQAGIFSWRVGQQIVVSAFTNVAMLRGWIGEQLQKSAGGNPNDFNERSV
ncbi:phenoloxidase-activating factor 2-like [Drosophila elegans]|uniref:phenoloxidase-activating factor 2-like n=1 Tax=Drosophila elegans TaxID=30023 RepID=UPI0007E6ED60|nr:phenoloxidase-activating factor 2-like [Drosophila elegans]